MSMKTDPKIKKLRALVRKAIKDGTLTEKELIEFIRSRRVTHPRKRVKIEDIQNL